MRKIPWAVVGVVLIALYNAYGAIRGVNDLTPTEAWVLTIVGILLAGFAGWQVWDQQNSNAKLSDLIEDMARTLGIQTSKEKIKNVTYFATPLTLRNLFDSDFPYAGKFGAFQTKDEATGLIVEGAWRLVVDFTARAKFLAYFIPSSDRTVDVCTSIASSYKVQLEDKTIEISHSFAGDSAPTALDEAQFSGRIFIYHESQLSLQQLASLEIAFREHEAAVIFRSHTYRAFHLNERRAKPGWAN